MLERNPVVAALLDDGLTRGYADPEIGLWLQERLQLIHASSLTALTDITPRRRWSILTRCSRISRKARW
jgi:16S rRNA (guanine1516-N2)-methyltransferase